MATDHNFLTPARRSAPSPVHQVATALLMMAYLTIAVGCVSLSGLFAMVTDSCGIGSCDESWVMAGLLIADLGAGAVFVATITALITAARRAASTWYIPVLASAATMFLFVLGASVAQSATG